MGQDQAAEVGNLDRVTGFLRLHVRHAEQDQWCAFRRLEVSLHRGNLGRLMFERVQPMHVAGDDLYRGDNGGHPHGHGEHRPCRFVATVAQQMERADRADDECRGEIGREHHVHQAIGEGRIEDDGPPVVRNELSVLVDPVAGRRLHPTVDREDPERRNKRSESHHQRREEMEPFADAAHPEQHHAEETCLEKECGQHLVAHERTEDRSGLVREDAPVGAELVTHDQAGDDAHAERERKYFQPVFENPEIGLASREQPQSLQDGEIARQTDGYGREHDVERDGKGELNAG